MKIKYILISTLLCSAPLSNALLGWIEVKNNSHSIVKIRHGKIRTVKPGEKRLVPTRQGNLCFVTQNDWPSTDKCQKFFGATSIEIENYLPSIKMFQSSLRGVGLYKARGWYFGKPGKWKYPWGK